MNHQANPVDLSKYKALVIDDEETVRTVISENLKAMGFVSVDLAVDGEEGLKKIRELDVDIVFLDLAMPGVPGDEVAHLALGMKPDLVIIVITGFATLEKAITLMRKGIYDLIRKPFTAEELEEKITAALEKSAQRRLETMEEEEHVGAYRILEEVATGGGGIVYRAEDRASGDVVALKILISDPKSSEEKVLRFHREARTIQALDHPHIVSTRDVGAHQGKHYIAMDFIEGRSLDDLITGQDLTLQKAVFLAVLVSQAVHYAHEKGILHRDIKPSNVLVDGNWKPHIIDFGLAKSIRDNARLTESKKIYGTLGYIAPERFTTVPTPDSVLMDVFSLGVLLYEMLTGTVPYRIDSDGPYIPNFCENPESPTDFNPAIPESLSQIVLRAINCDAEKRYQSAKDFAEDLLEFMRDFVRDFPLTYPSPQ